MSRLNLGIMHLGTSQDDRLRGLADPQYKAVRLRELSKRFKSVEPTVHEHLAQLVTYHAIGHIATSNADETLKQTAAQILDAFTKLLKHQPPLYRVEDYLKVPLDRVCGTIDLIKNGWLAGKLGPWKQVMTWK